MTSIVMAAVAFVWDILPAQVAESRRYAQVVTDAIYRPIVVANRTLNPALGFRFITIHHGEAIVVEMTEVK